MEGGYSLDYGVDLVFCIDATSGMDPAIERFRRHSRGLCGELTRLVERKGRRIQKLRVRLIAFRDHLADAEPMVETDFFTLPEQTEGFAQAAGRIRPDGGGDPPEDGLEALACAMRSAWDNSVPISRHIIVVWTDAEPHPLGYGGGSGRYPSKMARDFQELSDWWGHGIYGEETVMNQRAKRLVLFAPSLADWREIADNWNQVIHVVTATGQGGRDVDHQAVMSAILWSIIK